MKRTWTKIATALLFLFMSVEVTLPFSFELPDDQTLVDKATLIVAGKVESSTAQKLDLGGGAVSVRTLVQLLVLRCWKGCDDTPLTSVITIEVPGGKVGDFEMRVNEAPQLLPSREYLVLLQPAQEGRWYVVDMQAGEAETDLSAPTVDGAQAAEAHPEGSERKLDADLRARFRLAPPPPRPGRSMAVPDADAVTAGEWAYMSDPPVFAVPPNLPFRQISWNADEGLGQAGSFQAMHRGAAAWDAASALDIDVQESINPLCGRYCCIPGQLSIQWNDPGNEITDQSNGSGILAVGGPCFGSGRLIGGSIVMNDSWAGSWIWTQQNVEAIVAHELGHALDIAHCVPPLVCGNAQMRPTLRTGVGAVLGPWDVGAICNLYPGPECEGGGGGPTPPPGPTPTPTPVPTASPTPRPTRDPFACPSPASWITISNVRFCTCPGYPPSPQENDAARGWNKKNFCPRKSGKFHVDCACKPPPTPPVKIGGGAKGCR